MTHLSVLGQTAEGQIWGAVSVTGGSGRVWGPTLVLWARASSSVGRAANF